MLQASETVSVVICSYTEKRLDYLLAAIASVRKQTQPALEIIVIIDHNYLFFQQLRDLLPDISVLENKVEKGLSGARNTGLAAAKGTIIAYLDDDARPEPYWIEQLLKCYADTRVIGVGGKIEPVWPCLPSWFPEEFNWVFGCTYRGMPVHQAPVCKVIGANMSLRKQALTAIGGFRAHFGCNHFDSKGDSSQSTKKHSSLFRFPKHTAGGEETEMYLRLKQHLPDGQLIYNPDALVYHYILYQRVRWSYFIWRCYNEGLSKAQIVKLHGSRNGLAAERAYLSKTLPASIVRYILASLRHCDATCLMCVVAIMTGVLCTITGYAIGIFMHTLKREI
jgi:glucosyl-dolichyl phosphate glucuronosyltransferase